MTDDIAALLAGIDDFEKRLAAALAARRDAARYVLRGRKVVFDREIRAGHRRLKVGLVRFFRRAPVLTILTAPVIYAMIVPLALLDLFLLVYQAICFRAWSVSRVRRAEYVVVDRHHLAYLNAVEKLNCVFCGYANGVIAYAAEIAARTEQYWCPIKHARPVRGGHRRAADFLDYGDGPGWRDRPGDLRRRLR